MIIPSHPDSHHLIVAFELSLKMIYDATVSEFVAGGVGSRVPTRVAPPGLPSMSTVLSDPLSRINRLQQPVHRWKRSRMLNLDYCASTWAREDHDEIMDGVNNGVLRVFSGEESLIPDSIPEDIWQAHFRQHDADLSDRKETEFLLSLYKQCSGRWPVVYDRWQSHPVFGPRGKSIESLKSKFNKVMLKLLEVDALKRNKATTATERIQATQSLRWLPIFAMKYNEKNEYLRRVFLENEFRRESSPEAISACEKYVNELMRVPNLTMKHKKAMTGGPGKPALIPGPQLASSLIQSVHSEISLAESNRLKAILKSLGVDRASMQRTPKLSKLFSIVEREAHSLLMMRDSLQRKKQELEILRTSGMNGGVGNGLNNRPRPPPSGPPSQNVNEVLMAAASAAAQQKRKRP